MDDVKISKFLALILRHNPAAGGITLDWAGRAPVADVAASVRDNVDKAFTEGDLFRIVRESDKKRYSIATDDLGATTIQANQGHSIEVELGLEVKEPPAELFHGTTAKAWEAIKTSGGLSKMKRHAVHLSPDVETAKVVGARRGKPFVLTIDTASMIIDGFEFKVSVNGVWLVDDVPLPYIMPPTDV